MLNLPHNKFVHPEAVREHKSAHRRKEAGRGESGCAAGMSSEETRTALRRAAKDGDAQGLEKLLKDGAAVNTLLDSYDLTALHYAAWQGRTGAIHVLISHGAAIDARNRDQKTPLHLCAGNGKATIIRALLRQGASLTLKDREGKTPLDTAEFWGNVEAAAALRQAAHEQGMKKKWRPQSANKLEQPKRIASYLFDGSLDDWKVQGGFGKCPNRPTKDLKETQKRPTCDQKRPRTYLSATL
eukprot:Tamp_18445.p1 GENE.Tamp_18445~~Tamp_18445.p1  ORF type:complete len:241 (-),score=38.43 Tamp_18445:345-1067(-)